MAKPVNKNKAVELLKFPSPLLPADTQESKLTKLLKVYLPQKEIELVWEAYRYSDKAHSGQKRIGWRGLYFASCIGSMYCI